MKMKILSVTLTIITLSGCGDIGGRYSMSKTVIVLNNECTEFKMGGVEEGGDVLPISGVVEYSSGEMVLRVTKSDHDKVEVGQSLGVLVLSNDDSSLIIIDRNNDGHVFSK